MSITITSYYTSRPRGASSLSGVTSTGMEIDVYGRRLYTDYNNKEGGKTFSHTLVSITSSLKIRVYSTITDRGSSNAGVDGTWTFSVNQNTGELIPV